MMRRPVQSLTGMKGERAAPRASARSGWPLALWKAVRAWSQCALEAAVRHLDVERPHQGAGRFATWLGFATSSNLDDPVFGSLRRTKPDPGERPCWTGERAFGPLGNPIAVFIEMSAPEAGPSDAQCAFFDRVVEDYGAICAVVDERFFRFDPWTQKLRPKRFGEEFVIRALHIPLCREPSEEWSATFGAATGEAQTITVHFRGTAPHRISPGG